MDTQCRMMQRKRMRGHLDEALLMPEGCGTPLSSIRGGRRRAVNPPRSRGGFSGRRSSDIRALGRGTRFDMLVRAFVPSGAGASAIVEAYPRFLRNRRLGSGRKTLGRRAAALEVNFPAGSRRAISDSAQAQPCQGSSRIGEETHVSAKSDVGTSYDVRCHTSTGCCSSMRA